MALGPIVRMLCPSASGRHIPHERKDFESDTLQNCAHGSSSVTDTTNWGSKVPRTLGGFSDLLRVSNPRERLHEWLHFTANAASHARWPQVGTVLGAEDSTTGKLWSIQQKEIKMTTRMFEQNGPALKRDLWSFPSHF